MYKQNACVILPLSMKYLMKKNRAVCGPENPIIKNMDTLYYFYYKKDETFSHKDKMIFKEF